MALLAAIVIVACGAGLHATFSGVEAEISVNSRGVPNVESIRSVSPFSK